MIVARVGFPADISPEEARERALAHVRDDLGDTDEVTSVEVLDGDGELIVKIVTGGSPVPPSLVEPPEALAMAAQRARAFLAALEKIGDLA